MPLSTPLRLIDLCAGSGAFSLAGHAVGCTTVWANDFCPKAAACFSANITDCEIDTRPLEDVPLDELPQQADIICGGFSCQPFSTGSAQRQGLADPRAKVIESILKVAQRCRPRWLVCENVPGLLSYDSGRAFDSILALAKRYLPSYEPQWEKYNTATHTGIPQHRRRVYIVWFRERADYEQFEFPLPKPALRKVSDFLQPESEVPDDCYYANRPGAYAQTVLREVVLPVRTTQAVYNRLRDGTMRQNQKQLCPCVMSGMSPGSNDLPVLLDDRGARMITPREAFRLQAFPDSYVLPPELNANALYKVAGNAVTVGVAQLVLAALIDQAAPLAPERSSRAVKPTAREGARAGYPLETAD